MKKTLLLATIFSIFYLFACKQDKPKHEEYRELEVPSLEDLFSSDKSPKTIFFKMAFPLEMAKIFEISNTPYDKSLPNSLENADIYTNSYDIALNLGIYAVDLNYARKFEQNQDVYNYLVALKEMSAKLGVPDEFYSQAKDKVENAIDNKDSIYIVTHEVFVKTDKYLKQNDQDVAAALIMVGGWIESLYFSAKLVQADSSDSELSDRIIKQKYSLNTMIDFLYNFETNIAVSKYIIQLEWLQQMYAQVNIYPEPKDFKIDSIAQKLSADDIRLEYTTEDLNLICEGIISIRNQMIE